MLARFYEHEQRGTEAEQVWEDMARRFPEHNGVAFDLAACRERLGQAIPIARGLDTVASSVSSGNCSSGRRPARSTSAGYCTAAP